MRHDDVRYAIAAREDGLRRVRRLTVTIGTAGLACCAALFVAFGHSAPASASAPGSSGNSGSGNPGSGSGNSGSGGSQDNNGTQNNGSIQAPVQAPAQAPAQGPVQGVSGGS
jgi:hypothetical protein